MGLRLLIVEDDLDVREVLIAALEEWEGAPAKLVIETSADGLEAAELLHRKSFDLIISDIQMPRINGAQLVDIIRSNSGQNQFTPFIIISGNLDVSEDAQRRASSHSKVSVMEKPIDFDSLYENCDKALKS